MSIDKDAVELIGTYLMGKTKQGHQRSVFDIVVETHKIFHGDDDKKKKKRTKGKKRGASLSKYYKQAFKSKSH